MEEEIKKVKEEMAKTIEEAEERFKKLSAATAANARKQ